MKRMKSYSVSTKLLVAAVVTGFIFEAVVVGVASTNIFSVIFGWQWLYLAVLSVVVLVIACVKRRKKLLLAALIMLASLTVVLVPARLIESSGFFITGDGGPAGPEFACLTWQNSTVNLHSGAYEGRLGLCTIMSIPSYNKFLVNRSRNADQSDSDPLYYVMLILNQLVIIGGARLAKKTGAPDANWLR